MMMKRKKEIKEDLKQIMKVDLINALLVVNHTYLTLHYTLILNKSIILMVIQVEEGEDQKKIPEK